MLFAFNVSREKQGTCRLHSYNMGNLWAFRQLSDAITWNAHKNIWFAKRRMNRAWQYAVLSTMLLSHFFKHMKWNYRKTTNIEYIILREDTLQVLSGKASQCVLYFGNRHKWEKFIGVKKRSEGFLPYNRNFLQTDLYYVMSKNVRI